MPKRPQKYIDGLIEKLAPESSGLFLYRDDFRAFAEKVYRYALRNRKRESAERTVKEMFKPPEET